MEQEAGLKVVDALDLDPELVALLRPGEVMGGDGRGHRLPRYFYEVPSREAALEVRLAPHFTLGELMAVDVKEWARLRAFPRYVPCAVRLLAFYLERVRDAVGVPVYVAVNGGYRSPAHRHSEGATPHMWGTAADVYRVGHVHLRDQSAIETYSRIVEDVSDDLWVKPYGSGPGATDDHLHLDLGYVTLVPREIGEGGVDRRRDSPRYAFEERRRGDRRGWPREAGVDALVARTPPGEPDPADDDEEG